MSGRYPIPHHLMTATSGECRRSPLRVPGQPCWCAFVRIAVMRNATLDADWISAGHAVCGTTDSVTNEVKPVNVDEMQRAMECWHAVGHALFVVLPVSAEQYIRGANSTLLPPLWSSPACEAAVAGFVEINADYDTPSILRGDRVCTALSSSAFRFGCIVGLYHVVFNQPRGQTVQICEQSGVPAACFWQASAPGTTYSGMAVSGCGSSTKVGSTLELDCQARPDQIRAACELAADLSCLMEGGSLDSVAHCAAAPLTARCILGRLLTAYIADYLGFALPHVRAPLADLCTELVLELSHHATMQLTTPLRHIEVDEVSAFCATPRLSWFAELFAAEGPTLPQPPDSRSLPLPNLPPPLLQDVHHPPRGSPQRTIQGAWSSGVLPWIPLLLCLGGVITHMRRRALSCRSRARTPVLRPRPLPRFLTTLPRRRHGRGRVVGHNLLSTWTTLPTAEAIPAEAIPAEAGPAEAGPAEAGPADPTV